MGIMVALNVYIQGIEEKNFRNGDVTAYLRDIVDRKLPVGLSFVPARGDYSSDPLDNEDILNLTRKVLNNGGILGQQGLYSKCPNEHKWRDPWHENWCWNKTFSAEKQRQFMEKGRKILRDLTGFLPSLYSPPNHYFDETTLKIAEDMGYDYFADKSMTLKKPYQFGRMLVVPHGELHKGRTEGREAGYIHYDQIMANEEAYEAAIIDIRPFSALKASEVSELSRWTNDKLKYGYKAIRDAKRIVKKLFK